MIRGRGRAHAVAWALGLLGAVPAPPSVVAQEEVPAADAAPMEEIVVTTARLREENLQEVPLSVAQFSAEDIANQGIENLQELANSTPGVDFASSGSIGSRRLVIRGLSQQTRVGDEANVATFVDGVYTPGFSGTSVPFEAVERVEVIKGPQSALYGRNSFAGTVSYVLKKPSDTLELGGKGTVGSHEREAISGFATGPLLGDWLGARVDVSHYDTGGTHTNAVNGETLDSMETDFTRLALRSRPTDWLDINATLILQDDELRPAAQTVTDDFDPRRVAKPEYVTPNNPYEIAYVLANTPAGETPETFVGRRLQGLIEDENEVFYQDELAGGDRDITRGTFSMAFDLGAVTVTALSGYQDRDTQYLSDLDTTPEGTYFDNSFFGLIGGPGYFQTASGSDENRDEFSQDLRLQSNDDSWFQWLAGLYYSNEDYHEQRLRYAARNGTTEALVTGEGSVVGLPPPPSVDEDTFYENEFKSAYAAFDIDIAERWNFSAEGRYQDEEKSSNNVANNFPSGSTAPTTGLQEADFDDLTPRFILSWKPTDGGLVYASAAKGIKSGGFNPVVTLEPDEQTYNTEKNWTYELGTKWTLWEGRALLNGSVYYIDWQDQQILGIATGSASDVIITNVGRSEVKGAEISGMLTPTDWLTISAGYSYNDSEYKDAFFRANIGWIDCAEIGAQCQSDPESPTGVVHNGRADGKQLQNTAKNSFNLGVEARRPLTSPEGGDVFIRGDYSYRDKRYADENNIGWVPSFETVNLRMGLQTPSWAFEGFCDNMLDDDAPALAFASRDFGGVPHFTVVNREGRICGLTVSYRYAGS